MPEGPLTGTNSTRGGASSLWTAMPAAPIPGASQQELALWARNVLALALAALARELPAAAVALRGFYGLAEAG